MPVGKEIDFSQHLHTIRNLLQKLRSFEAVCGGAILHDVRIHLNAMVNWEKNLEFYSTSDHIFKLLKWENGHSSGFYEPSIVEINAYFNKLYTDAERFLANNVKYK